MPNRSKALSLSHTPPREVMTKFYGESEAKVRAVFELAEVTSPLPVCKERDQSEAEDVLI